LVACWKKGVEEATYCLLQAGHKVDFNELLHIPGVDLMRPHGDINPSTYPGVDTKDVDHSLEPDELAQNDLEYSEDTQSLSKPLSTADKIQTLDGKILLDQEYQAAQSKPPHSIWMNLSSSSTNTKPIHKSTILHHEMNPAFDIDQAASRACLLWVQAFSTQQSGWDRSISNIMNKSEGNVFSVNHLFAALIMVNSSEVSLAIINCTSIHTPTGSVFSVPFDEITLPNSKFDLSGQVLALIPDFVAGELVWNWQGNFIEFESGRKQDQNSSLSITHLRNLKVTVNGSATQPLQQNDLISIPYADLSPVVQYLIGEPQDTWRFMETQLSELQKKLYERFSTNEDLRQEIPLCNQIRQGNFPYIFQSPDNSLCYSNFID
jgi:hypothetical protein